MSSLLEHAKSWATRGFPVFPLIPGDKRPREKGWTRTATRDPEEIERLWRDPVTGWEQDFNVGVLCDHMIVLDIDVKGGRRGMESAAELGVLSDALETLTVRTPSGGLHLYYRGPNRSLSAGKLGEGLDVRSFHGFVVAPGSVTPHGAYALETDAPLKEVPAALLDRLDAPRDRAETAPLVDLDLETSIAAATEFLKWRKPAQAGQLNDTCYRVAAAVKDYGISEKRAVDLIVEHWSEKCDPPIPAAEVQGIVANAFAYGTRQPGSLAPAAEFAGVKVEAPELEVFSTEVDSVVKHIVFRDLPDEVALPARPWIAPGRIMRGAVTIIASPGGVGKSTLELTIAAHAWLGKRFAGFEFRGQTKALVINNEDDYDEMARRMRAICTVYDLDPRAVMQGVAMLSGADYAFKIADASPPKFRTHEMAALGDFCRENEIGVILVDPVVETHDSDENNQQDMKAIMAAYRQIARDYNIAVVLAHHTPKGGERASQDAFRGASAIINSARIGLTLFEASADDGLKYRIPPAKLNNYVRLDDAKANLTLRSGRPTWFRRQSVVLRSGDEVGVLYPVEIESEAAIKPEDVAREVRNYMRQENVADVNAHALAKHLVTLPGWDLSVFGGSSVTHVRDKIAELFMQPFAFEDGETLHTKAGKNKTGWSIVLE